MERSRSQEELSEDVWIVFQILSGQNLIKLKNFVKSTKKMVRYGF